MSGAGARVRAEGFGWRHPGREEPAFSGLDLEIPPGQKVLLLGPSGAGKSTLLHALAGLLYEDDGDEQAGLVEVDGVPPREARGRIGLMQQDPEASIVMGRVLEDLAFGPENLGVDPALIPGRAREALAAVGLGLDDDHPTSALSGGQKQRLGLAGILAMRPGLLLLDEPTANLDPEGVEEVRDAVVAAAEARGSTLVIVEHRVQVWVDHVDRVIVLRPGGGISHDSAPAEVLSRAREELVAAGVWVPGHIPRGPAPDARTASATTAAGPAPDARAGETAGSGALRSGARLLSAASLSVSRQPPDRRWTRARRRAVRRSGEAAPAFAPARGEAAAALPWGRPARLAAGPVDLRVAAGEHLAITGANGAGKSTLALTLAGLLAPAGGIVAASGELRSGGGGAGREVGWDPLSWGPEELITRVGAVFQEPEHQFVRPTVRAELELGPRLAARARREDPGEGPARIAESLLRRLRLDHVAEANPFTLSGGEKRRLSVGTAIAARPRVLLLDEPTFGQDAHTWGELVDLLRELMAEGTAVVSVTHDLAFVSALGGSRLRLPGPAGRAAALPADEDPASDAARRASAGERAADAGLRPAAGPRSADPRVPARGGR
ncbi:ABC transporter ATP-binding protein [Rothia halotolerans]|uniref:ABC transporter ATP-binding protein n=1 Tax=Rothia halotolerans TaxID=405770 RepID=UPI00101BBE33|nr:ABC transporter ATP-binding protein [Rothia halotolerans]